MPGAGCLLQRVLHVAKPWAFQSCEARRGVGGHDTGHPRGIWRHLRGASDACRVDGQRASGEPQTGSSSDARGGLGRGETPRHAHYRVDQSVWSRTGSNASSRPMHRTESGWPTSPCRPGRGACTWPSARGSRRIVGGAWPIIFGAGARQHGAGTAPALWGRASFEKRKFLLTDNGVRRGTQYTSLAFGKRCREMGVLP